MNKLCVFTPTFNRNELLKRLYDSLKKQTVLAFDWIIVDDCSNDDTECTVDEFISEKTINIIYKKRVSNGGKHRAINDALDIATGEYFFIVDSDDVLPEYAIETIYEYISSVDGLEGFAGVAGLKAHFNGEICGGNTSIKKGEYIDATNFERLKYGLLDDKAEIYKTNVLRKHRFPEFEGENFISEAICWDAIASEGKKLRWFNDVIYLCEYLEDGLSKTGANRRAGHKQNIHGYAAYVEQALKVKPDYEYISDFREYNNSCKEMKMTFFERARLINLSCTQYIAHILELPFLYIKRKIVYSYYKRGRRNT